MATDYQVKREEFGVLVTDIKNANMDFFRGKTLTKVFIIGQSSEGNPALLFMGNVPLDIKEKLNNAFTSIFG
jgi:hypothetical protein